MAVRIHLKKQIIILMFFLFGILLINLVSSTTSYCCEKTTYGAWCQNEEESKCDTDFLKAPTSCDATSYCRTGTCFDSNEGNCQEGVSQRVCNESGGIWSDELAQDLPQCQLGCCLIGDQAAFVTKTRCRRISSLYGLETNFKKEINNELSCLASVTSKVEGACVFEKEFEKTCKRTTKEECDKLSENSSFYAGKLCSANNLETNCAPTDKTTCVEGKDQVFYVDSCGNIANVYDASKRNSVDYWSRIINPAESCGANSADGNSESKTCGNCDYLAGSVCKKYQRGKDSHPEYGDYVCRDLNCGTHKHGESWCASSGGNGLEDAPGSRYFRLLCYNSEILVEPCADFRQEVCIQDEVNGFSYARCAVNRWQDCFEQDNQKDCENSDKRDCKWTVHDSKKIIVPNAPPMINKNYKCVPLNPPGLNFWDTSSSSDENVCKIGDDQCETEDRNIFGGKSLFGGSGSCGDDFSGSRNNFCMALGDCGAKENYQGEEGYYKIGDLIKKI